MAPHRARRSPGAGAALAALALALVSMAAAADSSFFTDVTFRLSCNGGGLGPINGPELRATEQGVRDALAYFSPDFTVKPAKLVRPPVLGAGTATIDVATQVLGARADDFIALARQKIYDQEVAGIMRAHGFPGLARRRPSGCRP